MALTIEHMGVRKRRANAVIGRSRGLANGKVRHFLLGGPSQVRTVLVEYVQVVKTPDGRRYTVVTAPPGSALDAGGRFGTGGVVGGLVAVGMVLADPQGGAGGSL